MPSFCRYDDVAPQKTASQTRTLLLKQNPMQKQRLIHGPMHTFFLLTLITFFPQTAMASEPINPESAYIFNSLLFLIGGFLVMFMAAGFAMLEAGLVRSTSVVNILTKNIALYSLAGLMYYLVGYNVMYANVDGGFIGTFSLWHADDSAALAGDYTTTAYAASADWFFQMVFVATAASVVSGTLAERIRLWPFLLFVIVLTGVIYPITGSWKWGQGWLEAQGFQDFAGSTLVHAVGGWAALTGALFLGARNGRFMGNGRVMAMPGSNLPLATLGTFILWLGWFGFNGASQLSMGSGADAIAISRIFANTNMAAAGGVIAAMLATQLRYGKMDLTMVLNGALAGLVSITAEPLMPEIWQAILIGAAGGLIVVIAIPLLDKLRIDDVVGAIPVHLLCGIWGTLIVPATNSDANLLSQAIGIASIGGFVVLTSSLVWFLLKYTIGLRASDEAQRKGTDAVELGMEAYPDFVHASKY
jgi:Amt family ammonium transporter